MIEQVKSRYEVDIVLVDDASSDDTAALARAAGARVLPLLTSLGAWGAMQTGLRYALKYDYDLAITMDADGQHEADSLAALQYPIMAGETDVVIGACTARGSMARQIAWCLFRWLAGITQEDLTSGLRAYNRDAIKLLASTQATLLDYQDLGVLLLLHHHGLRVCETEINMCPRITGKSRIFGSWWAVLRYMVYTTTLCIAQGSRLSLVSRKRS